MDNGEHPMIEQPFVSGLCVEPKLTSNHSSLFYGQAQGCSLSILVLAATAQSSPATSVVLILGQLNPVHVPALQLHMAVESMDLLTPYQFPLLSRELALRDRSRLDSAQYHLLAYHHDRDMVW